MQVLPSWRAATHHWFVCLQAFKKSGFPQSWTHGAACEKRHQDINHPDISAFSLKRLTRDMNLHHEVVNVHGSGSLLTEISLLQNTFNLLADTEVWRHFLKGHNMISDCSRSVKPIDALVLLLSHSRRRRVAIIVPLALLLSAVQQEAVTHHIVYGAVDPVVLF